MKTNIGFVIAFASLLSFLSFGDADAASGSSRRVYNSDKSIFEIISLINVGVFNKLKNDPNVRVKLRDLVKIVGERREQLLNDRTKDVKLQNVGLFVDGQKVSDGQNVTLESIKLVIRKITGFLNNEIRSGSVELRYEVRVRNLLIKRSTLIEDERLRLDTRLCGQMGSLTYARLTIDAKQQPVGGTRFVSTATVSAPIGRFRCGPVSRIAGRYMSSALCDKLVKIESHAKEVVADGKRTVYDLAQPFIDDIRDGLR